MINKLPLFKGLKIRTPIIFAGSNNGSTLKVNHVV